MAFPETRHRRLWRTGSAHRHDGRRSRAATRLAITREVHRPPGRHQPDSRTQFDRDGYPHRTDPRRISGAPSGGRVLHPPGIADCDGMRVGLRAIRRPAASRRNSVRRQTCYYRRCASGLVESRPSCGENAIARRRGNRGGRLQHSGSERTAPAFCRGPACTCPSRRPSPRIS